MSHLTVQNYPCDYQYEMMSYIIHTKNYNILSIVITFSLSLFFTILVTPNNQFFNLKLLTGLFGHASNS